MTPEEIKVAIADGTITAITLDTSVFGNPSEMNIEHGVLKHMSQFKNSEIKVITCDVVAQEVTKHLEQGAQIAQAELKKALKLVGNSWNKSREDRERATQILLEDESPKANAARRFKEFLGRSDCEIIKAADFVKTAEVISRYFETKPPFSAKESKKYEFPDAFAVLTLLAWAEAEDTKILVVSEDSDWEAFCKEFNRLVFVDDLGAALRYFHAVDMVAANRVRDHYQDGRSAAFLKAIADAIQDHIHYLTINVNAESSFTYDYELEDIEVIECTFDDPDELFAPIAFSEGFLVTEATATVVLEVEAYFTFTVRDGIDKDYFTIGGAAAKARETIELPIVINFGGDIPDAPEVEGVEILSSRLTFEFGYVEPNYEPDDDGD